MTTRTDLALRQLTLRLRAVNRALRAAVERQAQRAARLARPDVTPLCVTDDEVRNLLADVDAALEGTSAAAPAARLSIDEARLEDALRAAAARADLTLPLDAIAGALALTPFEQEALLLCAAPELDRSYERIYGYVLDDLGRRQPSVELLCTLTAASFEAVVERRRAVGRFGTLRRCGVLVAHGEAPNELRQELGLAPAIFDLLTGGPRELLDQFRDPAEVPAGGDDAARETDARALSSIASALSEGRIGVVGVWGAPHVCADAVSALARVVGQPLRRVDRAELGHNGCAAVHAALQTAAALGAVLWIDADALSELGGEHTREACAEWLAASNVPLIVSGAHAWRPTPLLARRSYAEIDVAAPDYRVRRTLWAAALTEGSADQLQDLAARYRFGREEVRAAVKLARTRAQLAGASPGELCDHLDAAAGAVARKSSVRFATVVRPRHGPDDLVLPPAVHEQVLEVAGFFRAWPHVADDWGFGRMSSGAGGIKALFTGDSGTGKTLAAEVIAGCLAMPLLKVDLSEIVSKWVGETEKHLETVFREAEASDAVLFFDEADALFGRRGEVQHGVDRYANLEVSYLLQRFEAHPGLVILASNLKDNIDPAFTRRFQIAIHFPRPDLAQRRRIWELAFPRHAPLEKSADLDALARLDLTGAGIVSAARTAALLAASEKRDVITKAHLARAIARQYHREARVLMPAELGPYAQLAQEAR